MEFISEPSTFHKVYYSSLIEYVKPYVDDQISSIPQDMYDTSTNYRQFLNRAINPLIVMTDSFKVLETVEPDFVDAVWNDISDRPFQFVLDYIFHVNTIDTSPFKNCYNQLIKQYSIQTIVAARVINDCFIHYLNDTYNTRHQE